MFAKGVQTLMVSLSTIAYPIQVVSRFFPSYLVEFIELNRPSQGAEALRTVINGTTSSPAFNHTALFFTSFILLVVGVVSYRHVFTALRQSGKI